MWTLRSPRFPGACPRHLAGLPGRRNKACTGTASLSRARLAHGHALAAHDVLDCRPCHAGDGHAQLAPVQVREAEGGAAERVRERHPQRAVQVAALAPERRVRLLTDHKHHIRGPVSGPLVACKARTLAVAYSPAWALLDSTSTMLHNTGHARVRGSCSMHARVERAQLCLYGLTCMRQGDTFPLKGDARAALPARLDVNAQGFLRRGTTKSCYSTMPMRQNRHTWCSVRSNKIPMQ